MHFFYSKFNSNRLPDAPRWPGAPKLKHLTAKVTIAIGMICKDVATGSCILLASDSQTTAGASKDLHAQKISIVNFLNAQVLVAQAGIADLSDKAINLMQRRASGIVISSEDDVPRVAQDSIREIRDHLIEINRRCIPTDEGWRKYFGEENYFELILGHYFRGQPHLATINCAWCLPIPSKKRFVSIGIGRSFSDYFFQECLEADPGFSHGPAIAAWVVEKTCQNVDGCSPPTWLGRVHPNNVIAIQRFKERGNSLGDASAILLFRKDIDVITAEVKKAESNIVAARKGELKRMLEEASKNMRPFEEIAADIRRSHQGL